jgi:hypothetical protein
MKQEQTAFDDCPSRAWLTAHKEQLTVNDSFYDVSHTIGMV